MPRDLECGETRYLTPERVLAAVRSYFGGEIDLDPATEPDNPTRARRFFTISDNGLLLDWSGRVFLNPPYGRGFPGWVKKVHQEAERGVEILALLPGSRRSETDYWRAHVYCAELRAVCYIRGRLSFATVDGMVHENNQHDSAICGYSIEPERFARCFAGLGACFATVV